VDKITVVCHKDHDKGYKDYVGKCLLCEIERLQKREWVGLTDEEIIKCFDSVAFGQVEDDLIINKHVNIFTAIRGIEAKLKEKNT
jgi:hypothetical protein